MTAGESVGLRILHLEPTPLLLGRVPLGYRTIADATSAPTYVALSVSGALEYT